MSCQRFVFTLVLILRCFSDVSFVLARSISSARVFFTKAGLTSIRRQEESTQATTSEHRAIENYKGRNLEKN